MTSLDEGRHVRKPRAISLPRLAPLHIITLFTLAVAHPLYDVLRQEAHAPFFFAHQAKVIDIWLLVLLFSFLLPAALYLALWLLSLLAARPARGLYGLLLAVLFFGLFLQIPGKLLAQSGSVTTALALLAAAGATLLYFRTASARTLITFMSVAVAVSPLLFLRSPSMTSFMSTPEARDYQIVRGGTASPDIIMMVFDELPLTSLLDENREIDQTRYPNFHRLTQSATWYRNATTIHYATTHAMASLLVGGEVGKYIERVHGNAVPHGEAMDRARLPGNVFSLVEDEYRVAAVELMSKLAPSTKDSGQYVPPLAQRMYQLALDSSVLYSHVITPTRFRRFLPTVEGQWRGFLDASAERPVATNWPYVDSFSRLSRIKQFIDSLHRTDVPSFYFLHSLLPHYPFEYNELGQIHANKFPFLTMHLREASGINDWPDETTAILAYQAHLLQLSFTDHLLGLILDKLVEVGLWNESLVIVASDHGTNFYWDSAGLPSEKLAEVQASGTLYVPLLIKMPGQVTGEISDKPVKTIDIVPTIADVLGTEIPWGAEGVSVRTEAPPGREIRASLPRSLVFGAVADPDGLALKRKIELFGTHSFDGLYQAGPHKEIIDRPLTSFAASTSTAIVELAGQYRVEDPAGPRLPTYVEGTIRNLPDDLAAPGLAIAVAVNGVIRNTTRTTGFVIRSLSPGQRAASKPLHGEARRGGSADGRAHFLVRLPPKSLVRGANEVTVHAVVEDERGAPASLVNFLEE